MMTLELPGCFAMTETGHGSDVQSLRTTATYDPEHAGVRGHTPDDAARKDYIGNAARDGRLAVVFAQLDVAGEGHGVHALVVPIRDEAGAPCPGVRIEDCGHKGGLNGVDNGRLWFDDVRVPRDALLDRYGAVARGRHVHQPDREPLGALLHDARRAGPRPGQRRRRGRERRPRSALAIAVALRRARARQFAPPGTTSEVTVLDYLAHQRRLLPRARDVVRAALRAGRRWCRDLHDVQTGGTDDDARQRELESRAAGLKAVSTWHATSHDPDLPRGVRGSGLPVGEPARRSSRPTATSSRRSRATTPSCCSWSPRRC